MQKFLISALLFLMLLTVKAMANNVVSDVLTTTEWEYNFDACEGTILIENNNNLNGTVNGATWAAGYSRQALSFDGIDDHVVLSGSEDDLSFVQNTGKFTISLFVKLNDLEARSVFLGSSGTTKYRGFALMYDTYGNGYGDHQLRFNSTIGENGVVNLALGAQQTINDNNWHHVAVVGDGSNVKFYVDGVQDGSSTALQHYATGTSEYPVTLGQFIDNYGNLALPYNGSMDELKIYNRPLSETEISTLAALASNRVYCNETVVQPSLPASGINFSNVGEHSMDINWTNGDGSGRIVLMREWQVPTSTGLPQDGVPYPWNSDANLAPYIGPNRVVYVGSGTGVTITGLDLNKYYGFSIFEFNGSGTDINYLLSDRASGGQYTLGAEPQPTTNSSGITIDAIKGSLVRISWEPGDGERRLVVLRSGQMPKPTSTPNDGWEYSYNTDYSQAPYIGPNAVVYKGDENEVIVSGLTPLTQYGVRIFEFNGTGALTNYLLNTGGAIFTTTNDVLASPGSLVASPADFDKIHLEWKSIKGIVYEIERSATSGSGFSLIATTVPGASTYSDHSLDANTVYYYRMRAVYEGDKSDYSTEVFATTKTPVAADITQSHKPMYNGNISAVKWKTHGDTEEKLYTYGYDPMNRITQAQYAQGNTAISTWTSAKGGYSVNNINYDLNGNIQSLNRQSMQEDLRTIDALTYSYNGRGNQLTAVDDAAGWDGFTDRNMSGDDYEYDANGNLTKDRNKGIERIEYNHLNLPEKVIKSDGQYIKYVYDATGTKRAQEVYDTKGKLVKKTEYIGEFIYETDADGNTELQLIQHEEGRIVKDETTGDFEYQYHLKDHLGNTRLTFTTKPKTIEFTGRFESETSAEEEQLYSGIDNTRVKFPSADATNSNINVAGDDEVIGLNNQISAGAALSIPVGPGDKLDMQVYSYYEAGDYSSLQPANAVLMAIAGAFGGANGGNTYEQSTYDAFNSAHDGNMLVAGGNGGSVAPAAYLNYILFDEKMNPYKFGHAPISETANSHELVAINDIVVDKAGFAYIYLSNESDSEQPVFFDDMNVVLKESNVVQRDDYYPFGLTFNSYQKVTEKENRYLYNGASEYNGFIEAYDTWFRSYDPLIGRFKQVDELADLFVGISSYHYAFNNPILFNDPLGLSPEKDNNEFRDVIIIPNDSDDRPVIIETDGPDIINIDGTWQYFGPDGTWQTVWDISEVDYYSSNAHYYKHKYGDNLLNDNYYAQLYEKGNSRQKQDMMLARHYANGQNYLKTVGVAVGTPIAIIGVAELTIGGGLNLLYTQGSRYINQQLQKQIVKHLQKRVLQRIERVIEKRVAEQRAIDYMKSIGQGYEKGAKNIRAYDKLLKTLYKEYFKL